jgi:hypothetical protein
VLREILISAFLASHANSATHETFIGEARENGILVYTEKHDVTKDANGQPIEAVTSYLNPEGKELGVLRSNFKNSLNLPEHVFEDYRSKAKYGIRRSGSKVEMFSQDPNEPEKTKTLESGESTERLQVGCQGFTYYLHGKVDQIKEKKILPVLFMIPGELSTYKFELEFIKENPDQTVDFTVKVENWFLRLFAPKLEFRYNKKINRIVWYKGLSNIKSDKGKLMDVVIDYKYL